MMNIARHEKSEGLELLSVGKLYTGPWYKKYWSSARGKDRFPYPVGYKSLRTQNGVTYTMEILEGLNGPLFTISSGDGKTCSGNTPDIALESFQNGGSTKLLQRKQLSCRLDGAEFFGFKNSLVQRFLRALVENVVGASELDICDGAVETADKLKCKATISGFPEPQNYAAIIENRNDAASGERMSQLGSLKQSSDPKIGQIIQGNASMSTNVDLLAANDLIVAQEPIGKSLNTKSLECSNVTVEQQNRVTTNRNCMPAVTDADDTPSTKSKEKGHRYLDDTNFNELTLSESPSDGSFLESVVEATNCCTPSQSFDSDSVGLDVTTSMMAVLLPQAVPLLKTYSRKKKKRKTSVSGIASISDLRLENEDTGSSGCLDSSKKCVKDMDADGSPNKTCEANDEFRANVDQEMKLNRNLGGFLDFFASYVLPMPILTVQLFSKERDIHIFVNCGFSDQLESKVFVYSATTHEEMMGRPSLIGYASIAFPLNAFGENATASRSSSLQLEPDSRSLVLLNSIETSYCSDGKLHCSCKVCASNRFKKSGIKIVKLNSGFVSLVSVLETTHSVSCFLVCGPNFLLVAEEGGKLNMWIMNSEWSQQKEISSLPASNGLFPCITELKRVPNSPDLVVGHNGVGNFCLWDVNRRILVSTFSSSRALSVSECLPASSFAWRRKPDCDMNTLLSEIMGATGEQHRSSFSSEVDDKDIAVWLLISTAECGPDLDCCYRPGEREVTLALLINDTVITGSVIDRGIAAVTSGGRGIMCRNDGVVYAWELSTGTKSKNLRSLEPGSVSCVATNSGVAAVASGNRLLVYLAS